MRIEQLEYLHAVIRHGSMRRAGEQLHISQPALSEAVRNLERELGTPLLDRRPSGAKVNAAGRDLLPYVTAVLESVRELRAAAGDQHGPQVTLRLGTVNAATVPIVAPAIRDLAVAHPEVRIEIRSLQQDEIRDALLDGSLDLGLVNLIDGDDPEPRLVTTVLLQGRAVLCCRPDSPLAALSKVSADDIAGEPLVFMRSGYVMHRYLHRVLGARRPLAAFYADGAEMGKTMVAEGLGVTVLPDYSVVDDPLVRAGMVTYRPLADERTAVSLVVQAQPRRHRSPAVQLLENALRDRADARRRAR